MLPAALCPLSRSLANTWNAPGLYDLAHEGSTSATKHRFPKRMADPAPFGHTGIFAVIFEEESLLCSKQSAL